MFSPAARLRANSGEAILDRLVFWLFAVLVLSILAFGAYYYLDRRGAGDEAAPLGREVSRFEDLVREAPSDAPARVALARLYAAQGRFPEAAEQYGVALEIEDDNLEARVGMGEALLNAGRPEEAAESFRQVIAATEEVDVLGNLVAAAHYYLGVIALEGGDPEEAIVEFQAAVAVDRADADAWYFLGKAYQASGDWDGAITALTEATRFVPNFPEAYELMGAAYASNNQLLESRYAEGMRLYSLERFEEAVEELDAVARAAPSLVVGQVGLGLALEELGRREEAIAAFQMALALKPDDFNANAGLFRLGAAPMSLESGSEEVAP